MNKSRPFSVKEAKIQASQLLKSLRSSDARKKYQSVQRLQKLAEFPSLSVEQIDLSKIKLKHALAVIALENGFNSWVDLKVQINFVKGGFLNKWFRSYEEAKLDHENKGGFLLPYKNQFFICEAAYIQNLGLEPENPDWKLINYDWVNPSNKQAWQRLCHRWREINESNND